MRRSLAALAILLAPLRSRADTIVLRNGNELEGLVQSQSSSQVEIDLGYGTVTVPRENILKIKRSRKGREKLTQEVERRKYLSGLKVPKRAAKLNELFQEAKRLREAAEDAKEPPGAEEARSSATKARLGSLSKRYEEASNKLKSMHPKDDPGAYNGVVGEVNSLAAQLDSARRSLEDGQRTTEAAARMQDYFGALFRLKEAMQDAGAGARGWEADYYACLRKEVAKMDGDVVRTTAHAVKNGEHLIVTALINGRVAARLMVDTGASMVLLYKSAADKLGLGPETQAIEIKTRLADGSVAPAREVRLASVAVGDSRVDGVEAAIVDGGPEEIDGLLGMSFLSHFSAKIDAAAGSLVLERLK